MSIFLSEAENLTLIKGECGLGTDAEGIELMNTNWKKYQDKEVDVRVLLTKIGVLRYLQGKYREAMNLRVGPDQINLKDLYANATSMLKDAEDAYERLTGESGPGVIRYTAPSGPIPAIVSRVYGGKGKC